MLQQIADVLKLTKGKNAPSFALMKKGTGDEASLWSNYNIQLVEYEDHGHPLAELLQSLARQAFHRPPPPAAASAVADAPPASMRFAPVPRPALEEELVQALRTNGRLLVLAPRRGGARSLSRSVAAAHFGDRVTWLSPPNVPSCTAEEYFSALSGDPAVKSFLNLETWLHERARALGGEHLIVLRHDGGPLMHLKTVGNSLRKLLGERVAGRQVRKLAEIEDQLQYAEVRLSYDGLVMAEGDGGATVFRCEAARRAAERTLALEEGP